MSQKPIYLDCNATTPIEPRVYDRVCHFLGEEFGNAASRTHVWGATAKKAVQAAREQVAQVVACKADEVIFTSGATESNNLALMGLAEFGEKEGRKHLISSVIEHKAILEPLEILEARGFEITLLESDESGRIDPAAIKAALRDNTLAVSVMHVNNETGVIQPLEEIAEVLSGSEAFFHVDAAQGFGKDIPTLQNKRIDLISISGHKIYAPKGVGALIARRRGFKRLPLKPIMYGGGQERGLRPGTLPVHLIAGLGEAAEIAFAEHDLRTKANLGYREKIIEGLAPLQPTINGAVDHLLPTCLNFSLSGVNSEAAIVALKDIVSISNGSACTSQSYEPSHVLVGMGLDEVRIKGALRVSWCHMSENVEWASVVHALQKLAS